MYIFNYILFSLLFFIIQQNMSVSILIFYSRFFFLMFSYIYIF